PRSPLLPFSSSDHAPTPHLHSFPTRRSSDLSGRMSLTPLMPRSIALLPSAGDRGRRTGGTILAALHQVNAVPATPILRRPRAGGIVRRKQSLRFIDVKI